MIDSLIVSIYLLSTLFLGFYYSKKITTIKEFLVSKREFSDNVMIATLFATVIGGGTTCGVVSNVYMYGIIYMIAFYGAVLNKILVAHYVAPKLKDYVFINSLGDLFEYNYGEKGRFLVGISTLFVSVTTLGQQIMALGFILEYFFNIPYLFGSLLSLGTLVIYSALGGVRAVVMTDVYQFILIMALIPLLFLSILSKTDVFSVLNSLQYSVETLSNTTIDSFITPFTMFVVMTFTALDPSFIQRLVMSKNKKQAVYITKITGYISFPLITFMGFFGVMLCQTNISINPSHALPFMIDTVLPPFLKGIGIVSLLSVIMSTADSNLHVSSCSIVQDIILLIKKDIPDKIHVTLVRVMMVILSIFAFIICMLFNNIFDIMIFSFGFWGPTIIIPLLFSLYKNKFNVKDLFIGVFLSQLITIAWNIFLKKYYSIDGLIVGMLFSFCFFITRKKFKSYAYN